MDLIKEGSVNGKYQMKPGFITQVKHINHNNSQYWRSQIKPPIIVDSISHMQIEPQLFTHFQPLLLATE